MIRSLTSKLNNKPHTIYIMYEFSMITIQSTDTRQNMKEQEQIEQK